MKSHVSRSASQQKNSADVARSGQQQGMEREGEAESSVVSRGKLGGEGFANGLAVQRKALTIGEPNDRYEQEADRVAAEVVQRLHRPLPERLSEAGEEQVQRQVVPSLQGREIFRKAMGPVRRSDGIVSGAASPAFESGLRAARGGGRPLDGGFRERVEPLMGQDFSSVRVHTDGRADELSRSIQAKAFTTGRDVFFRKGEYAPGSRGGQELLAHELTHVGQQREAEEVQRKGEQGVINELVKPVGPNPMIPTNIKTEETPYSATMVPFTRAFTWFGTLGERKGMRGCTRVPKHYAPCLRKYSNIETLKEWLMRNLSRVLYRGTYVEERRWEEKTEEMLWEYWSDLVGNAALKIGVGNCGEHSKITALKLKIADPDQYVCRLSMYGRDHALNMTVPAQYGWLVRKGMHLDENRANHLTKAGGLIVDTWWRKSKPIAPLKYWNGYNPYSEKLTPDHGLLVESKERGRDVLSNSWRKRAVNLMLLSAGAWGNDIKGRYRPRRSI